MEPLNVADYERLAAERLDAGAFDYFAGGAGDEWTLGENVAAFDRWVLRPRMLVDVGRVSTAISTLDTGRLRTKPGGERRDSGGTADVASSPPTS